MRRILPIAILLAWFFVLPMVGEEKLSTKEINAMKQVGIEKILSFQEDMNKYIYNRDSTYTRSDRLERAYTHTLLLFIDRNRQISVTNKKGDKIQKDVISYLTSSLDLSYTQIDVTYSNIYYGNQLVRDEKVSKERNGDWYTAVIVYTQDFKGWKGKEAVFSDSVERTSTVYIEKITEIINGKPVKSYHALLGDSDVTEIL